MEGCDNFPDFPPITPDVGVLINAPSPTASLSPQHRYASRVPYNHIRIRQSDRTWIEPASVVVAGVQVFGAGPFLWRSAITQPHARPAAIFRYELDAGRFKRGVDGRSGVC